MCNCPVFFSVTPLAAAETGSSLIHVKLLASSARHRPGCSVRVCETHKPYALGRISKALGQGMSEDLGSWAEYSICFPQILNRVPDALGNVLCSARRCLAAETRRASSLQDLFIQDQASACPHLDFITSSPPPSPFI